MAAMTTHSVLVPSGEALQRIAEDRATRVVTTRQVPFFELHGEPTELCPVGTVTVVMGLASSDLLAEVEAALEQGDREALNSSIQAARERRRVQERIETAGSGLLPESQALEYALQAPAYADVRYLGRTLVSNIFPTTSIDFGRFFMPYAGGPLEASDFQAAHYLKEADSEPFEIFVVAHPPTLSAEQKALARRLPLEEREMLITPGDLLIATPTAFVATVTAALVGAAVGYAIGRALQHFSVETFQEIERRELSRQALSRRLGNISPAASVQELLAAKREALAGL
ncbi:hypothetical protein AB0C96_41675 [Streptomyces sp. NPDC048506]|uniref:hypothetical protein n=1 Tax=Streptomyces sp. NPDC048506 TaxID=3155028 RepID=UPI0034191698